MADESKPPLQYQVAPSPVTRGQFRLLLLLMLIQVVITAQSTYAPGFIAWVRERWAEHQQAVAHRALVRQNLAAAQKWLSHTDAPETVVWDEDPDRAAKLLATPGYLPIEPYAQQADGVQNAMPHGALRDLRVALPPIGGNFLTRAGSNSALAFLHSRRASNGPERLVAVTVSEFLSLSTPSHTQDAKFDFSVYKLQTFSAQSYAISSDGDLAEDGASHNDLQLQAGQSGVAMPGYWTPSAVPGNPGSLRIEYRDQLRVFAGQADPSDASHFTIAYDLDGQPGVIDGWLNADGSVKLEPRVGKRVNKVWYPHAK